MPPPPPPAAKQPPAEQTTSTSTTSPGEPECAWCKFMRGGPCRAVFETWQACVDGAMEAAAAAEEEAPTASSSRGAHNRAAVETCAAVTAPLFECMAAHKEYYGSQLDGMAARKPEAEQQAAEQQLQQQQADGRPAPAATAG